MTKYELASPSRGPPPASSAPARKGCIGPPGDRWHHFREQHQPRRVRIADAARLRRRVPRKTSRPARPPIAKPSGGCCGASKYGVRSKTSLRTMNIAPASALAPRWCTTRRRATELWPILARNRPGSGTGRGDMTARTAESLQKPYGMRFGCPPIYATCTAS